MKKVTSSVIPEQYWIRKQTDKEVFVKLRKNIEEKTREDEQGISTYYEYDEVEVIVKKRQDIETYITTNFDALFLSADVENLNETISSMALIIEILMAEVDTLKGGA